MPPDWKMTWSPSRIVNVGPKNWVRWTHPSGYTIGEVDAGKYMATNEHGRGLRDADGIFLEWSQPEHAADHIATLVK